MPLSDGSSRESLNNRRPTNGSRSPKTLLSANKALSNEVPEQALKPVIELLDHTLP